jgi:hypothetical protein
LPAAPPVRASSKCPSTTYPDASGWRFAGIDSRVTDNIVRVGLNYKWGMGGPVVAKY